MKFLITQSSPAFCHILPLKPKYSPLQPILKHCFNPCLLSVGQTSFHNDAKQGVKFKFCII